MRKRRTIITKSVTMLIVAAMTFSMLVGCGEQETKTDVSTSYSELSAKTESNIKDEESVKAEPETSNETDVLEEKKEITEDTKTTEDAKEDIEKTTIDTEVKENTTVKKDTDTSEPKKETTEGTKTKEEANVDTAFSVTDAEKTMYATASLNIRINPNTSGSKLGAYHYGQEVKVTGSVDNGWYQVDYNGQTGYVSGKYLTEEKPVVSTSSNYSYPITYSDSTANITITREWYENAWCYAAHIVFSDYDRLGTSCGDGYYGGYETTSHAAKRLGAKLCINGCYSAPNLNYAVARDGVVYNDKACWTPAVYNSNNGLLLSAWETGGTPGIAGVQLSTLVSEGKVTDTFCFGPPILKDGVVSSSSDGGRAQRTFIGTNGNAGDIWLVVSDGRYNDGESAGLTYKQCSAYLASKGCTFGVPLDGGGSSTFVWNGKVLNAASNQRSVVDFVYFK